MFTTYQGILGQSSLVESPCFGPEITTVVVQWLVEACVAFPKKEKFEIFRDVATKLYRHEYDKALPRERDYMYLLFPPVPPKKGLG